MCFLGLPSLPQAAGSAVGSIVIARRAPGSGLQQRRKPACSGQHLLSTLSIGAVRFAMDRAGLVGADGATHCGAFDITYMAQVDA